MNYEIAQPQYFDLIKNIKLLRVTAQIRLCNKYNTRVIINNKIIKARPNEICLFCKTKNDLYHMLNDCPYFSEERIKTLGCGIDFKNLLSSINYTNIKCICEFLELLYEKYKKMN